VDRRLGDGNLAQDQLRGADALKSCGARPFSQTARNVSRVREDDMSSSIRTPSHNQSEALTRAYYAPPHCADLAKLEDIGFSVIAVLTSMLLVAIAFD
jgi:hypothetical protein